MMMFWIFFIVDLFTIGIFYAVYGGKREYSEGMLMGVHMPRSAAESEEVSGALILMVSWKTINFRMLL